MKGNSIMHKCGNKDCSGWKEGKCIKLAIELDRTGTCIGSTGYIRPVNWEEEGTVGMVRALNDLINAWNKEHKNA